jgi:hypothetical protein
MRGESPSDLKPEVLRAHLEARGAQPPEDAIAEVLEHLEAGRFEDAATALRYGTRGLSHQTAEEIIAAVESGADPGSGPSAEDIERATFAFELDHGMVHGHGVLRFQDGPVAVVGRIQKGTVLPGDEIYLYCADGSTYRGVAVRAELMEKRQGPADDIWELHMALGHPLEQPHADEAGPLAVAPGDLILGFTEGDRSLRQTAADEIDYLLQGRGLDALSAEEMGEILDLIACLQDEAAMARLAELRPQVSDPDVQTVVRRAERILRPDAKQHVGQCFIATAACGSPDHRLVRELREYRDTVMVKRAGGRWVAELYRRWSPPMARAIAEREPLRRVARRWIVRPAAWWARHALRRSRNRS